MTKDTYPDSVGERVGTSTSEEILLIECSKNGKDGVYGTTAGNVFMLSFSADGKPTIIDLGFNNLRDFLSSKKENPTWNLDQIGKTKVLDYGNLSATLMNPYDLLPAAQDKINQNELPSNPSEPLAIDIKQWLELALRLEGDLQTTQATSNITKSINAYKHRDQPNPETPTTFWYLDQEETNTNPLVCVQLWQDQDTDTPLSEDIKRGVRAKYTFVFFDDSADAHGPKTRKDGLSRWLDTISDTLGETNSQIRLTVSKLMDRVDQLFPDLDKLKRSKLKAIATANAITSPQNNKFEENIPDRPTKRLRGMVDDIQNSKNPLKTIKGLHALGKETRNWESASSLADQWVVQYVHSLYPDTRSISPSPNQRN